MSVVALLFLDDLSGWLQLVWFAFLFFMAYWIYKWVEAKLGFSQLLVFAVAAILIYFLVIENPIIAGIGIFSWIILSSGVLMILQIIPPIWYIFHKR